MKNTRLGLSWPLVTLTVFATWDADAVKLLGEESYKYSWSTSASLIVEGTITARRIVDSDERPAPYTIVRIGISNAQRGSPSSAAVRVIIEDDLQLLGMHKEAFQIGSTGIWYLNRIRQSEDGVQEARLIRYINSREMDADPGFMKVLGEWVIEKTIDQEIERSILNRIDTGREEMTAAVVLSLQYAPGGLLDNISIKAGSGNRIFDQHVLDAAINVHRTLRYPQNVGDAEITIVRKRAKRED